MLHMNILVFKEMNEHKVSTGGSKLFPAIEIDI